MEILKSIKEILGEKEIIKTNNVTSNLYYENELGGLEFGKSFKIFSKKNKKDKKGNILEEEVNI